MAKKFSTKLSKSRQNLRAEQCLCFVCSFLTWKTASDWDSYLLFSIGCIHHHPQRWHIYNVFPSSPLTSSLRTSIYISLGSLRMHPSLPLTKTGAVSTCKLLPVVCPWAKLRVKQPTSTSSSNYSCHKMIKLFIYGGALSPNPLPVLLCCRTGIGPLMLLACTLWRIP